MTMVIVKLVLLFFSLVLSRTVVRSLIPGPLDYNMGCANFVVTTAWATCVTMFAISMGWLG